MPEPDEEVCNDLQTVQLGAHYATDLRCTKRKGHTDDHGVSRWFGIVRMSARWTNRG